MQKDDPSRAGLLVIFPLGTLNEISHGGLDIYESRPVANISKAVTGLCIAGLIMDEQLKLDDTLAKVLPKKYLRNKANGRITIEQLLTHSSGVFGNKSRKKSAFYQSLTSTVNTHGVRSKYFDRLVPGSLSQELVAAPGEQYIYSNTNYLVLGKIIEHLTKLPYEEYCSERVLAKADVEAALDLDGKILSSYTGWRLSAKDALKVFALFDPANGFLSHELADWNSSSENKLISKERSIHYGFGTVVLNRYGNWYYHRGRWHQNPTSKKRAGSLAKSYATMALYTDEGVGIFFVFEPGKSRKSAAKLRDMIFETYQNSLQ